MAFHDPSLKNMRITREKILTVSRVDSETGASSSVYPTYNHDSYQAKTA